MSYRYIIDNAGSLIEIAKSCGYDTVGFPRITIVENKAELILVYFGRRYLCMAQENIEEVRNIMINKIQDCGFYVAPACNEDIRDYCVVIYDKEMSYERF